MLGEWLYVTGKEKWKPLASELDQLVFTDIPWVCNLYKDLNDSSVIQQAVKTGTFTEVVPNTGRILPSKGPHFLHQER